MSALVYVSAAVLVFVLIMVFVNGRKVQELRDDLDNLPRNNTVTVRDTALASGLNGVVVPKTYYWVDVQTPLQVAATGPDEVKRMTVSVRLGLDTDGAKLVKDIQDKRVTFLYRPEKNMAYRVEASTGSGSAESFVVLNNPGKADFLTQDLPNEGRLTIVGLPGDVLHTGV